YRAWVEGQGGYGILTFPEDESRWVLRLGDEGDRYVHVHPGRWTPATLRVRANVLKTAVMVLAYVGAHGGDPLDRALVHRVPGVAQPGQAPQQVVSVPAAGQQLPPAPTPSGVEPQRLPQKELAPGEQEPLQLRVYSHSNLYYWWPVWAVGFLMAALTYFNGAQ